MMESFSRTLVHIQDSLSKKKKQPPKKNLDDLHVTEEHSHDKQSKIVWKSSDNPENQQSSVSLFRSLETGKLIKVFELFYDEAGNFKSLTIAAPCRNTMKGFVEQVKYSVTGERLPEHHYIYYSDLGFNSSSKVMSPNGLGYDHVMPNKINVEATVKAFQRQVIHSDFSMPKLYSVDRPLRDS